jgi:hypothetical protein
MPKSTCSIPNSLSPVCPSCSYYVQKVAIPLVYLSMVTALVVGILGIAGTASSLVISGTLFAGAGITLIDLALPTWDTSSRRHLIGQLAFYAIFGGLTFSGILSPYTTGWATVGAVGGLIAATSLVKSGRWCLAKSPAEIRKEKLKETTRVFENFEIRDLDPPLSFESVVVIDPAKDYRYELLDSGCDHFYQYRLPGSTTLWVRFSTHGGRYYSAEAGVHLAFEKGADGIYKSKAYRNAHSENLMKDAIGRGLHAKNYAVVQQDPSKAIQKASDKDVKKFLGKTIEECVQLFQELCETRFTEIKLQRVK